MEDSLLSCRPEARSGTLPWNLPSLRQIPLVSAELSPAPRATDEENKSIILGNKLHRRDPTIVGKQTQDLYIYT